MYKEMVTELRNQGVKAVGVVDSTGNGVPYLAISIPDNFNSAKALAYFLQMKLTDTPEKVMLNVLPNDAGDHYNYELFFLGKKLIKLSQGEVLLVRIGGDFNHSSFKATVKGNVFASVNENEMEDEGYLHYSYDTTYIPDWVIEVKGGRVLFGFAARDTNSLTTYALSDAVVFSSRESADNYIWLLKDSDDFSGSVKFKARELVLTMKDVL